MREMIRLFVVVLVFSCVSGGLLAVVRSGTQERIEYQQLKFVKGPTIKQIMEGCSNDPLSDRFKIMDGDNERSFFVGEFDGKRSVVAFESFGKGFGGNIGVIVAINVETDKIVGIGVTTHSETPGLGSRAKSEPDLSSQFKGLPIKEPFKVTADGGKIDAISGATMTSRGVCGAVVVSAGIYERLKNEILKKIKT
jgi:electron transport complex protein RnfG